MPKNPKRTFLLFFLVAMFSSAFAAPSIKGETLTKARSLLQVQGWKPRETFGVDADGRRWSKFGDAGEMYEAGFIEVASCSGTGRNFCSFNYSRNSECLSVMTEGEFKAKEYEPTVIKTSSQCPSAGEFKK